ncbi:MAG: hypothetical protein NW226_05810 [Microscillaceae bacterium]|nr:hypothetical protein [Microscillaceae bacterium]
MLGRATNNNVSTGGVANIEGIQPGGAVPFQHGGTDDTDNSGVIRYVSIRHGGTEIGNGNEINGLTLGSVGNGTTIDFVEVISNRDDGVEWFGGTVNTKHLITAFCGDDAFDWDLGFRGKGQFWFAFQDIVGDAAGELDGGVGNNECSAPFSAPVVANVTFKGNGNTEAAGFFDNSAGQFWRSLFVDHRVGIEAEDRDAYGTLSAGSSPATCGCDDRIDEGTLAFVDNVFFNVENNVRAALFTYTGAGNRSGLSFTDSTTNTVIGDPLFGTGKVANGDVFECVPSSGITLFPTSLATLIQDPFFEDTNYAGAFTPAFQGNVTASWASRWTMWSFVFANPGGNLGPGTGTESPE